MTMLILYIMGANEDPDNIHCRVPFLNDNGLIFFGPCMKDVRKSFRQKYLLSKDFNKIHDELYIVSVNAKNNEKIRKILWAGRIIELMTFEKAFKILRGPLYRKMRNDPESPLHLEPLIKNGNLIGYRHRSGLHQKSDDWIEDISGKKDDNRIMIRGRELYIKKGFHPKDIFVKDCCFLCERIFYALRTGMPITRKIVSILKKTQNDKDVNSYAIFGYNEKGELKSRRPYGLKITDDLAEQLIKEIEKKQPKQE